MSENPEHLRKRLLDARAALDRATRAFSNDPLYDELAELRAHFDYKVVDKFYERDFAGAAKPDFLRR